MKKILWVLLATALIFITVSCALNPSAQPGPADPDAPPEPVKDYEREKIGIFIDGKATNESGYEYSDLKKNMAGRKIDGIYYYGTFLPAIIKDNLSSVKGAFLEAIDGYVSYIPEISELYLAAYAAENEKYESISCDGKHLYDGVVAGGNVNKGVVNIYLVTTPAEFTVEIQKNGQKIGELSMAEFMNKTPVGDKKVPTTIFEGSFMYDGGASTYTGHFLGISYETMLAKLTGLGLDLSGTVTEVEYYGTTGLGKEGKNEEYSTAEGDSKYFGSVDFICMFDGMTCNDITTGHPLGLTAFINGSGGRWMTHNLTSINFIVE